MSELFIESFIKGIGKTSAAVLICGFAGSVFYFITQQSEKYNKKYTKKNNFTQLDEFDIENESKEVSEEKTSGISSDISDNVSGRISDNVSGDILDAKKIFDGMISKKRRWSLI